MSAGRDKLEEAHQLLVDGVAALVSGEQWQAMLEASARFHSYSPNNVMPLMLQGEAKAWTVTDAEQVRLAQGVDAA
jgi:hypothetical protein